MYLNKNNNPQKQIAVNGSYTRKAIITAALSVAFCPLFAQSGFDFGLKGIFQASALINTQDQAAGPELDYKIKTGIAGGVSAGYSFTKHLGAEIDILSSTQGEGYVGVVNDINSSSVAILSNEFKYLAQANNIPFTGNYTAQIYLHCLKIPLLFRYTGDNTKKVFFSSFIGPQINMLSSAKLKINGSDAPVPAAANLNFTDAYKKTTLDVAFGFGAGMNITDNLVLSLHLRLDYGLGDAENKSASVNYGSGTGTSNWYNSGRSANNNATGGGMVSISYRLVKKAKEPVKKSGAQKPPAKK